MTPKWFGAETGNMLMIAPLATLVFLATLWLLVVAAAELLGRRGSTVLAALRGRSPLAAGPAIAARPIRVSPPARPKPALRAQPRLVQELRAAA